MDPNLKLLVDQMNNRFDKLDRCFAERDRATAERDAAVDARFDALVMTQAAASFSAASAVTPQVFGFLKCIAFHEH
jgi:hypothetical protein